MLEKLRAVINRRPVREAWQVVTKTEQLNVDETERLVSLFGGGLLLYSLLRRSPGSISLVFVASYLIYRGVTGYCPVSRAVGLNSISRIQRRQIEAGEAEKYQPNFQGELPEVENRSYAVTHSD